MRVINFRAMEGIARCLQADGANSRFVTNPGALPPVIYIAPFPGLRRAAIVANFTQRGQQNKGIKSVSFN
jgi:hypothetical protein